MSNTSKSSGLLAASASIATGVTIVVCVDVNTDGTNAATVILYDNPSAASGKVLGKFQVAGATLCRTFELEDVKALTGVYVSIAGTGAEAVVRFR